MRPSWSIVLAGGEGERTRAFVGEWLGAHRPKQYCAFTGTRSLFQHTIDRADRLSGRDHRVVVASAEHREYIVEQLRGRGEGRVLFQPRNRGTAVGVFLALTVVRARDPRATVVIYPSDHFVYPESAFLAAVENAVESAEEDPSGPVLLGIQAHTSELDYGWIVPAPVPSDGAPRRVAAFVEKPTRQNAERARASGGLWNTLIVASKVSALWALGWRYLPEIMPPFVRFWETLRAGGGDTVLEELYQDLPSRDLSYHLLQRAPQRLRVVELGGVRWSDWGRPERILETLRELGLPAAFPEELVTEPREREEEPCLAER
jgi:mannose-1-phosphate guanylyltransferase